MAHFARSLPRLAPPISKRSFSTSTSLNADFAHTIIGAGVVGLATAHRLAPRGPTLVLEQHATFGAETSSRNSEVIHAGLYYPADSLKTRLCLRGKELLYAFADRHGVAHRRCGKWIVAQTADEAAAVERLRVHADALGVPVRWLGAEERARRDPAVRAAEGALESPSTGIIDSHGLMAALEGGLEEEGGWVAYGTRVTRVEPLAGGGFRVYTRSSPSGEAGAGAEGTEGSEESSITTDTLVNAAGLHAVGVFNALRPPHRQRRAFYAKGTYYAYAAARPKPRVLVYPAPAAGGAGLGTHLTLDLAEPPRVRFGPDVEWVAAPDDYAPTASAEKMAAALAEIRSYLPGVDAEAVEVDYCGIRPKLREGGAVVQGGGFQDFVIEEDGEMKGLVDLLGIESPGLTSSLAIGEMVKGMLYGSSKSS